MNINMLSDEDKMPMLETILDNLREGVNVVNENGILIFSNRASADYAHSTVSKMIGSQITEFYPRAALLEVLRTKKPQLDVKIEHDDGRKYVVNAVPLIINGKFKGGVATFRDVTEIENLGQKLELLKQELTFSKVDDAFELIVGKDGSLKEAIIIAQRSIGALGGPRHSVISGESGTGKTLLARAMFYFAKKIHVISEDASFIEVNCAQFTNPDIAAVEIFGSEKGAFTGATEKRGLFELADGGVLFLDEAHALAHYQTMLLKAVESGKIRRIGGRKDIDINVIVIAASTKNLKNVLLPELYQRLAQYEIKLPPLRERPLSEKEKLLNCFIENYEYSAGDKYNVRLKIDFTNEAKGILLNAYYPRNIRQFRDITYATIDAAVPLISDVPASKKVTAVVDINHIPFYMFESGGSEKAYKEQEESKTIESFNFDDSNMNREEILDKIIFTLNEKGLGPRKIARVLEKKGYDIKYYQVAYRLKKQRNSNI
ncbi:MAG TPA: sigma 54-interacting transcriptional regulator [Tepidanaerobacter syntrophicus]|uniref:sigma 54-interacting transcriptional regulator n=1 Tax=Tepidanaerobacter syntrophicus TaxID=224999 RepID=UPI0017592A7D|nr:sigma 54-interacting transcriptional regulator [Tepidanaerobacter syntrophicus]HHV83288.1 sigma 54-interacting transcriptional regulator [Tepidanaerobacter syntrophicus]